MDELKYGTEVSVQFYGKIEEVMPFEMVSVLCRSNGREFLIFVPEEFIEDVG